MGNLCSFSISTDRCLDCIIRQANYTRKLEENLGNLGVQLEKLKQKRDDITTKVEVAEQKLLKRRNEVQGWLSRAENVIAEAEKLKREGPQEIQKLWLGGCFSKSYCSTYKFAKDVKRKLGDIRDLNARDFDVVADEVPAASVDLRPSGQTVGLESTMNEAWSCLEENHVGTIGLYGMGGVGKTTLLTQINNKLKSSSYGFDFVIWVVVSRDLRTEKIQDDIGEKIGFSNDSWKSKRLDKKAIDIFQVLSNKKFVLLLDDIWKPVDLSEVGIPLPSRENGCKVFFTTRSLEVCGEMGAKRKIKVECLGVEKAWKLFEENVGEETLNSHMQIRGLAEEVARECDGLPLALITIGRAMSCKKTPEEWKRAIKMLRKSTNCVLPDLEKKVYPLLKFSYDSLESDILRSCFLYCGLFPEDHHIYKTDLIDLWIGEGFLDGMPEPRNEGIHIICSLLRACLLEESSSETVKMHDVIRDMALWIYDIEKENCMVEAGAGLVEVPEVRKRVGLKRVSLMQNQIANITELPTCCCDLQALFLRGNELQVIGDTFFQFMTGLTVLDLSYNRKLKEFPVGISELVSLRSLNLSYTQISKLPAVLKRLKLLKCFNLTGTPIQTIARQVISSFSKLQVMRMQLYDGGVEAGEEDNSDNILSSGYEYLVEELQCLQDLAELTITIRGNNALKNVFTSHKLQSIITAVTLQYFRGSKFLNITSLTNMENLEIMFLMDLQSLEEVIEEGSEIARKTCFHSLRTVVIDGCSELKDATWVLLAPNLSTLRVRICDKLEEIISRVKLSQVDAVGENLIPFSKLECFLLRALPRLESIYPDSLDFPCLHLIDVRRCPMLRKLPLSSHSQLGPKFVVRGTETWQRGLLWEDDATQSAFIPFFKPLPEEN